MEPTLSCAELKQQMEDGSVVVIDVLTPEDYAACHIAGTLNACVYEMAFLDQIAQCVPDREAPIVVYDATGTTRTAENAREKLLQAGYRAIAVLRGGLSGWRSAGYPVEGSKPGGVAEPFLRDRRYAIDVEKSRLEWIGRNLNNRHYGRIVIAGGELVVRNHLPAGGRIALDMSSISDLDLQEDAWRNLLTRHLKSEDFFAVARFPTATFVLSGWEPLAEAMPGSPNGTAAGLLTIKDVTRPVALPAQISAQEDGSVKIHASFEVDRTLWNVRYGSGKLYERLGMHLVHDLIGIELFIVAK